jgi:hypothetical protein
MLNSDIDRVPIVQLRVRDKMQRAGRTNAPISVCLFSGLLLLVGNTPLFAGAPATRVACGQCEEADRFVRLQTAMAGGGSVASQYGTHPFVLDPEDWQTILSALHVRRQAEGLLLPLPPGPLLSAFTKEDIAYLSTTLSKAFTQAEPTEWVVFGLSHQTPQGLTEITTGGAYVEGPSLHIVLANFRKTVSMPGTRQLLWERPLRPDAGPAYDLVAGDHQTVVRDPGAGLNPFASAPAEVSIAYQPLLLREPTAAAVTQETLAVHPPPARSSRSDPSPPSIEDHLRLLKRLHAQGLISDEDYRAKKQQLLERF